MYISNILLLEVKKSQSVINSWSRSLWYASKIVYFFLFLWRFTCPVTYCCVMGWAWRSVLLRIFVIFLCFFIQNRLTWALLHLIPIESIILERTWAISTNLCSSRFFRFNGMMRFVLFSFFFNISQPSSHIVASWTWNLITFILTSISKIDFLCYIFKLFSFLGPSHRNRVVVGRRAIIFLLSMCNFI